MYTLANKGKSQLSELLTESSLYPFSSLAHNLCRFYMEHWIPYLLDFSVATSYEAELGEVWDIARMNRQQKL